MLQAHSFLWHYGWIAPNVLTAVLATCVWWRGLSLRYPVFCYYLVFVSFEGLSLYALDVSPSVNPTTWWYAFWAGSIVEGLWKFAVIAELLHHLLHSWPSVAKLGRNLISAAGVILVLIAAVAAAFAAPDKTPWLVGGAHILSQTLYLVESGVIVSIFVLAACFKVPWDRTSFGIALAFAIVWCEHLAAWALIAGGVVRNRGWEDLAFMGTYHLGVLIWFYYLVIPRKVVIKALAPLPENSLAVWNRELERLLQ
jgi:hypothetical protein